MKRFFDKLFDRKAISTPRPASRRLGLEGLEGRIVPAAITLVNGGATIEVVGTAATDGVAIHYDHGGTPSTLDDSFEIVQGGFVQIMPVVNVVGGKVVEVKSIQFDLGAGNDYFVNDTHLSSFGTGGDGNDLLFGGSALDILEGGAGNDELHGRGAGDSLEGGDDMDEIYGGDGNDSLKGGDGWDYIEGNDGDDWLDGGDGLDVLRGGDGYDSLWGGKGNDLLYGGDDGDHLYGGEGHDSMHGGKGDDVMYGDWQNSAYDMPGNSPGDGDDKMFGNAGDDEMYGNAGDDLLSGADGKDVLWGEAGNDELHGGMDDDMLKGGGQDDVMFGGGGDDTMEGDSGADHLNGGDGDDTIYAGSDDKVDTLEGGWGYDDLYLDVGEDKGDLGPDESDPVDNTGNDWARALACGFLFPFGCLETNLDGSEYPSKNDGEIHDRP